VGDHSQKAWDQADRWQREAAIRGVTEVLANPDAPASARHEAWLEEKKQNGWKFGPIKSAQTKEHPCYVLYSELPLEERIKDHLFHAVVGAFMEAEYDR